MRLRKKQKIKGILSVILYFLVFLQAYSFRIDDINFDQQIDNSESYKEYKVFNDGMSRVRYKIMIRSPKESVDIGKILTVYPKILTIDPKSNASFKIFGNSKGRLEDKEYMFNLELMPVVVPTLQKNGENRTIRGSSGVMLTPSITMSGYGGNLNLAEKIVLKNIELKEKNGKLFGRLVVKNESYSGIELAVKFYNKDKTKLDTGLIGRVNKGEEKEIEIFIENFKKRDEIKSIIFYNTAIGDIKEVEI